MEIEMRPWVKLPKDMYPAAETLAKCGFEFMETGSEHFYNAKIPKGWEILPAEKDFTMVDHLGRERGVVSYDIPYFRVFQRYRLKIQVLFKEKKAIVYIYDAVRKIVILEHSPCSMEKLSENLDETKRFLDHFFEHWEDPMAYWD